MSPAGYPQPFGRRYRRQQDHLAARIDGWTALHKGAAVNRHDYPELTRSDILDLAHERGWYYRGEEIDAARWPLFLTRQAPTPDGPLSPEERLRAELGAADRDGRGVHLVNLVPYQSMSGDDVELIARRESWLSAGRTFDTFEPTLRLLRPGRPALDQFAPREDVSAVGPVPPAAEVEVSDRMPRPVRRAVNRAVRWGIALTIVLLLRALSMFADQQIALVVTTIAAALIAIPFTFLAIRARRVVALYRRRRRSGRMDRNITRS